MVFWRKLFLKKASEEQSSLFFEAVKSGNLEITTALIADYPDLPLRKGFKGATPLHEAANYGWKEVAAFLLLRRAEVNAMTDKGWTPLHCAAFYGHKEVAELLLSHGANADASNLLGDTPLHLATMRKNGGPLPRSEEGCRDVLQLLLSKHADVNARNNNGWTPLHEAGFWGTIEAASLLLIHGAQLDARDHGLQTPLYCSVRQGRIELVELLLSKGADISARDRQGDTALHAAVKSNQGEVAKLLLARSAPVNARDNRGCTPLHFVDDVHEDLAELIRSYGGIDDTPTPIDEQFYKAILSISKGPLRLEEIKALIKAHPELVSIDSHGSGETPLHFAAMTGDIDLAELLLEFDANVNARSAGGSTPLHLAVGSMGFDKSNLEVARLLIAHGADMSARDSLGRNAAGAAALWGRESAIKLLMEHSPQS